MAEIVNLRQRRKQKARAEKEAAAAQNRLTHGRRKDEKDATTAEQSRLRAKLEGHKKSDGDGSDPIE